jgi:hypothetical protein
MRKKEEKKEGLRPFNGPSLSSVYGELVRLTWRRLTWGERIATRERSLPLCFRPDCIDTPDSHSCHHWRSHIQRLWSFSK